MAILAHLVRALDCGSRGNGFEPHMSPYISLKVNFYRLGRNWLFCFEIILEIAVELIF